MGSDWICMALEGGRGNEGFMERTRTLWNGRVARVKLMGDQD